MDKKIGRNDPCPCGSGKKYKSCCLMKKTGKKKLTAKWINAPQGPNLMERSFGNAIATSGKTFTPLKKLETPSKSSEEPSSEEKKDQ